MNIQRLAILGSGSMGTAILSGLLKSGFDASRISVSTKSAANASKLADEYGVNAFAQELDHTANSTAVSGADLILVAVKPAYVVEVLKEVAPVLNPDALVISVAAGITNAAMQAAVPESVAVIRSMPNTPAIVGRAVTGLASGDRASAAQLDTAKQLFETVGKTIVLEESMIDALSTISGSGPAYVFYLVEQLTAAAQDLGFSEAEAQLMVHETFLGAAELIQATQKSPAELRRQVTSPNGTTMRAIAELEKADLHALFVTATRAALARAKEIAEGR